VQRVLPDPLDHIEYKRRYANFGHDTPVRCRTGSSPTVRGGSAEGEPRGDEQGQPDQVRAMPFSGEFLAADPVRLFRQQRQVDRPDEVDGDSESDSKGPLLSFRR